MVYADKLHDIINPLESGGIVLMPTDTIWSLVCSVSSHSSVERLRQLVGLPDRDPVTVLVKDLDMLKSYVNLHPRIETLHLHHVRPLTVLYKDANHISPCVLNEFGGLSCRIVKDDFVKKVIDLLGTPIAAVHAHMVTNEWPEEYDDIAPSIINSASYVCQHRRDDDCNDPAVVVTHDKDGDLIFLSD